MGNILCRSSFLSSYKTETLEVYLLLLAALVGDAQLGCCHAAKLVACVDYRVVLAVVEEAYLTVATATGVMRVLNNRHYLSDVLVGAAVGILTAELAYWAADAIFNDRKLMKPHRNVNSNYIINNY